MEIKLSEKVLNIVINYLAAKPYAEVRDIIALLENDVRQLNNNQTQETE